MRCNVCCTVRHCVCTQVMKRETERQAQARLNSYSYMAHQEALEPWQKLHVLSHDSDAQKARATALLACMHAAMWQCVVICAPSL